MTRVEVELVPDGVVERPTLVAIGVTSAKTDLEPGAEGTPRDVLHGKSPDNELLRTMAARRSAVGNGSTVGFLVGRLRSS